LQSQQNKNFPNIWEATQFYFHITMDIFKLLSRSTKQKNKISASSDVDSKKLPSAGNPTNPQLYHDAIPEIKGKKRKRVTVKDDIEVVAHEDEEEVNFFAPSSVALRTTGNTPTATEPQQQPESDAPERLDEEECRQILRSHRLKLTILHGTEGDTKKVKKSKKATASKKDSFRNINRQIFPQPLMAFRDLKISYGIEGRMSQNLFDQGYKIPTEVQMASLPLLLRPEIALEGEFGTNQGVNLLAIAPTGSGKTLAFMIPIVDKIIQRRRRTQDKVHNLEAVFL